MFLSCRSTQAEYFDAERSAAELAEFFRSLNRVNHLFGFSEPFQYLLPKLVGKDRCHALSLLDIGAGDGTLGKRLTRWAKDQGWQWRVTNVDLCRAALRLNPGGLNVAGSAVALPFKERSYDIVIASHMIHHLDGAAAEKFLRESWRVARQAIFLIDLHRNAGLYSALWLLFRIQHHSKHFCSDALLSVKRGWRVAELESLAAQAGITRARVRLSFGARVVLESRKQE